MGDDAGLDAAHLAAIRTVSAEPARRRGHALADAVVEFGPSFVDTVRWLSSGPAGAQPLASGQDILMELATQSAALLSAWLTGERITSRADEGERRVRAARQVAAADPDDPVLTRLAVDAILRLPAEHEERDAAFARDMLLRQLDRNRYPGGDVNDLLMASVYLLHHSLLAPGESAQLIDEAAAAIDTGHPHPAAVRDLLHAAHNYCVVRAGEELALGSDEYAAWMTRADRVLAIASGEGIGLGPRLTAMRARQLDVAGDLQRAADTYAELVDAGDPQRRLIQFTALSEATLRLQTKEYQRLVDRLAPLLPVLTDRYLTAVTEADIADAGFAHSRAVALMANALTYLGRYEEAIHLADTSKSLRLRYRVVLRQHPAQAEILELERAILALERGGTADASADSGTGADLPLRARLLERYRRLRPDLGDQVAREQSTHELQAALKPGEGAVILAGLIDMTTVSVVTTSAAPRTVPLPEWPWSRWENLLAEKGGWLDALARRSPADGRAALERLIVEADRALGECIVNLIDRTTGSVRKISIIPHRWLHLIPYGALPSLAELPVSVFSSADELVTSRARPPAGAGRGCLVVANPTRDLRCSPSEAESVGRLGGAPGPTVLGPDDPARATVNAIAAALPDAALFHFSGHAYSDHLDPDRSALLVAPSLPFTADPFPAWVAGAGEWRPTAEGWQIADVAGVGRLTEREYPGTGRMERRMERGSVPTLHALYIGGQLRRLGELWSAGDILVSGRATRCRFAFLSACESGVAGGKSSDVDEYGGLPAALRLGGVDSLVCSLWPVDEGFTALYVDLFYAQLSDGRNDPVVVARQVSKWLRQASKHDVLEYLGRLEERVRKRNPSTAMALEAYRTKIDRERGEVPFDHPWEWASFYPVGGGTIDLG